MHQYNKILYVSHGVSDEKEGLKQALSLARNNQAPLKILVLIPEFPKDLPEYKDGFEKSISETIQNSVKDIKQQLKIADDAIDISIELAKDKTPTIKIIKQVLQKGFDLVIKEAGFRDNKNGFKAVDMDLLRKCPAPLWLCRPITKPRDQIKVATAIDPESTESAAQDLSERLLQLSDSLAGTCNKELQIVSCWDYDLESTLKNSAFVKIPEEEVDQKVEKAKQDHYQKLNELIKDSGIKGEVTTQHLRGNPADLIPNFVNEQNIDILVMGTVARTGIAGFMIGNTAENVIQQLSCSLLALKPHGFDCPVKL